MLECWARPSRGYAWLLYHRLIVSIKVHSTCGSFFRWHNRSYCAVGSHCTKYLGKSFLILPNWNSDHMFMHCPALQRGVADFPTTLFPVPLSAGRPARG